MAQPDAPNFRCLGKSGNELIFTWQNNGNCGTDFIATRIFEGTTPTGPFTEIFSTSDPNTETVDIVNATPSAFEYYFIQTECASGTADSEILDELLPAPVEITGVTIFDGTTQLSWEASSNSDAFAYAIYRLNKQQSFFQLIDTVFITKLANPNNPLYEDPFSIPGIQSEEYSVTVLDSCGNGGSVDQSISHSTIFLTTEFDSCSLEVKLTWTPYIGWETSGGVESYRVFRGFEPVAELSNQQFSYTYQITSNDPQPVIFSINALKANGPTTSISNQVDIDTDMEALPSYVFIRNASVIDENKVRLEWNIDPDGEGGNLKIIRGDVISDLSTINNLGSLAGPLPNVEVDNSAETGRTAFHYAIVAENSCGVTVSSDTVRTIYLEGQDNLDLSNGLFWNELEIPQATIQSYTLNRIEGGLPVPLQTFNPGESLTYIDDVSGIDPDDGFYCYRVDAEFSIMPPNGFEQELTSLSNIFCLGQTSRIFVPNTFAPNGINNLFKPVILFPDYDNYDFKVFNRWGEIVYETTDPDDGWDGLKEGTPVQQGVYAYYISMLSTNGNQLQRKGTVLLVK